MSDTPPQDPWAQPGAAQQPPEEPSAPEAVPPAPSDPPAPGFTPPPAPGYPPAPGSTPPPPSYSPPPSYPPAPGFAPPGATPPGYPPAPGFSTPLGGSPPPSYAPPGYPPPSYPPPPGYPPQPPFGGYPAPAGQLVGWWRRVGATLVDAIIFVIVDLVLRVAVGGGGGAVLYIIINAAYLIGLIGSRGQTLGNMAVSSRVVDAATGQPPSYGKAAIRWLVELVLGITGIGGILDELWPLWDSQNQTLHDKAAGTLVVSAL